LGMDYPPEVFLRTPVTVIRRAVQEAHDIEQYRANLASSAIAKMATQLDHVVHTWFQAPGECKSTAKLYLPFPDWENKAEADKPSNGPSMPTELVLRELIASKRIPLHVFVALMKSESR
jgi:hypothetical protein